MGVQQKGFRPSPIMASLCLSYYEICLLETCFVPLLPPLIKYQTKSKFFETIYAYIVIVNASFCLVNCHACIRVICKNSSGQWIEGICGTVGVFLFRLRWMIAYLYLTTLL